MFHSFEIQQFSELSKSKLICSGINSDLISAERREKREVFRVCSEENEGVLCFTLSDSAV